jgi:PAS domain-containing protein
VFIADKDLFFTECNHAASLLFGLENAELLHHSLLEFVKEDAQKKRLSDLLEKEAILTILNCKLLMKRET